METTRVTEDTTMWIPVCCGRVMRHSLFPGPGGTAAGAALTCASCGKHVLLHPEPANTVSSYGSGSRTLAVLGSSHAMPLKSDAGGVPQAGADETMS